MQRPFLTLVFVIPLACLALPANLNGQDAAFYNDRSRSWNDKGQHDQAIADYNQALRLNPNNAVAYSNRGWPWYKKGEFDKAIADANQSLKLDPDGADAHTNRGLAWASKGEYKKAIADHNEALRLSANHVRAYRRLAWLQATCPDERYRDAKSAFINANQAYQLSGGKYWRYYDTLAAAYAENGDFKLAREWEEKAIGLVDKDRYATDQDRKACRARLELYLAAKPYRDEPKRRSPGDEPGERPEQGPWKAI